MSDDKITEVEVFNSDDYILIEQICEALEEAKIGYIKSTNSFSVANALQVQTGFNTNSYKIIVSNENENKAKEIIENIANIYINENYTEEIPEELREYEEDEETEEIEEEAIFPNKYNLKSIDDCIKRVDTKYNVALIILFMIFVASIVNFLMRKYDSRTINWNVLNFVFSFTFIIYLIAYEIRKNKIKKTLDELSDNNMVRNINNELANLKYVVENIVITNNYIIDCSYALNIIRIDEITDIKAFYRGIGNNGGLVKRGLHIICNDGKKYNIETMYPMFIYNVIKGKDNPEEGLYVYSYIKLFLKAILYTFLFFAIYTIFMYIYISCQD